MNQNVKIEKEENGYKKWWNHRKTEETLQGWHFPLGPGHVADTQACGQMALPSGQASVTQGVLSNLCADSSCKLQHEAKPSELGEESPHSCFLHFPGGTKEFWGDSGARGGPPPEICEHGRQYLKTTFMQNNIRDKMKRLGDGRGPSLPRHEKPANTLTQGEIIPHTGGSKC